MIDHNKITTAKIAHKLSGNSDIVRPGRNKFEEFCKSVAKKPSYDIQLRNYEIQHTDDHGRVFLAKHHLKKLQKSLSEHIERANSESPIIVFGGNSINDIKYMSSITHYIDGRMLPITRALGNFTHPTDKLLNEYQFIVNGYKETVEKIKSSIPKGSGQCKRIYEKLLPEYIRFLKECVKFLENISTNYRL
jgi:hypothetical protein